MLDLPRERGMVEADGCDNQMLDPSAARVTLAVGSRVMALLSTSGASADRLGFTLGWDCLSSLATHAMEASVG